MSDEAKIEPTKSSEMTTLSERNGTRISYLVSDKGIYLWKSWQVKPEGGNEYWIRNTENNPMLILDEDYKVLGELLIKLAEEKKVKEELSVEPYDTREDKDNS